MKLIRSSNKTILELADELPVVAQKHGFGTLHVHDITATLNGKGVAFDSQVRVFEVCNPHQAKAVLDLDISMNMMLPCRISLWEEAGSVKIGTLSPVGLVQAIGGRKELLEPAKQVEQILSAIIDELSA